MSQIYRFLSGFFLGVYIVHHNTDLILLAILFELSAIFYKLKD